MYAARARFDASTLHSLVRDRRFNKGADPVTAQHISVMGSPTSHIQAMASDVISGMYRFTIPIRKLIEQGTATGDVHIGLAHKVQIQSGSPLLIQRHLALPPSIVATLKQNSCRIVHDLDDLLWSIPQDNPNVHAFTSQLLADMDRQLRCADLITVSTEPLAQALRERGYEPSVLPNTLDLSDWSVQPPRAERQRLRIGWYGQRFVHTQDLALIAEVVRTLVDEVDFVFLGEVPAALADMAARVRCYLPVPLSLFPTMLAALDLDLVLAPLARNAFNECKSNLRLLQAGMLRYPVVATDIEPHRTLPVKLLSNTATAWINAIRERMHDVNALRREGETLRDAVHKNFLACHWAERYFALWTGASVPAHA